MLKAFYYGTIFLVISYIILFFAICFGDKLFGIMSFYFQVVSPFIASLITSYFAPKKQLVLGITMVIPAITLGIFLKFTYWFLDIPIDYFGFKGEFIVASLYFAIYIPICFVGSLLGYFLYKYMHRQ